MMFPMPLGNHYDDHDANNDEDYCDEEQGTILQYLTLLQKRKPYITQQEVPC